MTLVSRRVEDTTRHKPMNHVIVVTDLPLTLRDGGWHRAQRQEFLKAP